MFFLHNTVFSFILLFGGSMLLQLDLLVALGDISLFKNYDVFPYGWMWIPMPFFKNTAQNRI